MEHPQYIGRFAPTPSGPLHLGSLLTATASWLDARAASGQWRLRIDDLDTPRNVPGAEAKILSTLESHGLTWDGPITRQSERVDAYRDALDVLSPDCFACRCSRRDLRDFKTYPGTCRSLRRQRPKDTAQRLLVEDRVIEFNDRIQGRYHENLSETVGDFVVWRRDDIASYQLAVVVDDALDETTHIVRGADLLDNTPRQIMIRERLHQSRPARATAIQYAHLPVIAESSGVKLSKHNDATAIEERFAPQNLAAVLDLLGVAPPFTSSPAEMLAAATRAWRTDRIPARPRFDHFMSV